MKLRSILESILKGGNFKVYHGSNHQFTKFDLTKMAQNAVWFSDSIQDIKSGSAGADSVKFINIDELERDGFDGVILEQSGSATHYIVFNPKNIKFIRNID